MNPLGANWKGEMKKCSLVISKIISGMSALRNEVLNKKEDGNIVSTSENRASQNFTDFCF